MDKEFTLPKCCIGCLNLDSEWEEYKPPLYYCIKNVIWPTRKQTCKKQKK